LGKLHNGPFLGIFRGGLDFFDPLIGPLEISLEMAHYVVCPQKKIISRNFKISGALIVKMHAVKQNFYFLILAQRNAGILEQSMRARNQVGIVMSYRAAKGGIFKPFRSPGIDSKESIPPVYLARRAGTTALFLAPIDCSKLQHRIHRLAESIPRLLKSLKIPSLN
jgi:hypothetical protein